MGPVAVAKRVAADTIRQFNDDDSTAMAARIALSMTMALFPFLLFATSLAGFLGFHDQAEDFVDLVFEGWPKQVAEPISEQIQTVLTERHIGLLSVGAALTVVFASNGVEAIRGALSQSYRAHEDRSFFRRRAQSLLFVVGGALLLLLISFLLIVAPYVFALASRTIPDASAFAVISDLPRYAVSIGAAAFVVFACHVWLPAGRRPLAELWPGILTTLGVWIATTWAFAFYLGSFSHYSAMYAGLAGIITAQIFLYMMAVILILGAQMNVALWRYREPELVDQPPSKS